MVPEGLPEGDSIVIAPLQVKIGGFFRVQLRRKSGSLRYDTGWFKNLITDFGMDLYGANVGQDGSAIGYCCVGTGASAPNVSDVALVAPLAYQGYSSPTGPAYIAGPPAYLFQSAGWAFPLGSVIGNISEISAGPLISGGGTPLSRVRAYSRQLILDSGGIPTTISVTSADQLNTSYQVRLYYDLTDSTTSITISGNSYGGTIRRALTSGAGPTGVIGVSSGPNSDWGSTRAYLYNGTIGTTSSQPGGSFLVANTNTLGVYTPGTFTRACDSYWNTTAIGGGTVNSISLGSPCMGFWQANLAPGFTKSGSNTLNINWSMAWARF